MKTYYIFRIATLFFVGTIFFLPSISAADKLIVNSTMNYDDRSIDLRPGEKGELTVYLRSAGENLDGITVELDSAGSGKRIALVTDVQGMVTFPPLEPGTYRLRLRSDEMLKKRISVDIGDFTLKKLGSGAVHE